MNLIEQLGGYEEARGRLTKMEEVNSRHSESKMCGFSYTENALEDLRAALLEYRRQHNIYEASDLVVMVDEDDYDTIFKVIGKPQRLYHLQGNDDLFYGRLDFQIRHATDEEIKSGDRIKQEAKS